MEFSTRRRLAGSLLAILCALLALGLTAFAAEQEILTPKPSTADLFHSTNLLHLSLEIPPEGMNLLRQSGRQNYRGGQQGRTKAEATLTDGTYTYTNVAVMLKGLGSYRPIDGFPGLTLNFNTFATGQSFHGLTKISLNNSTHDPTCFDEKIARELFAVAGVPVPRSDWVVLTLNGRRLGVYVLLEGYDKRFLKQHFEKTGGNLYDGGFIQDINYPLELNSGPEPVNRSDLARLVAATREADPEKRFDRIAQLVDMDRFFAMMAVESISLHWDSYSRNRNNYRIYHDPKSDKFVFMPHGMDQVLGYGVPELDTSLIPPMQGMVSRALMDSPRGRRLLLEKVGTLYTNIFNPDKLCDHVRKLDTKIAPEMINLERRWSLRTDHPTSPIKTSGSHELDMQALCARIYYRAGHIKEQLALPFSAFAPAPMPIFESQKAPLTKGWVLNCVDGGPKAALETTNHDGREVLHVRIPPGAAICSVRQRLSLPAGSYQISGKIKMRGIQVGNNFTLTPQCTLRCSTSRFGEDISSTEWTYQQFGFQIARGPAPEEIEMIWSFWRGSGDVWLDVSSLRVQRVGR